MKQHERARGRSSGAAGGMASAAEHKDDNAVFKKATFWGEELRTFT